ncbi:hypothetical protein CBR_g40791 [Chara braunii]|uniref:DUF659 domain-containing protein n=1 Tax=Chara braunii TaxID=69332 RepID=A0A388LUI2_CHABU|nr:hypothetical protein CBR_g40791 [Chara braunii]|eukprot:GBG85978.1 hypothetical protein CBR_g40791 [Chara braunii]
MVRSKYFLRMLQKVREAERSFIPAKYDVQRTKRLDLSEARVTQGIARQQKRWARTGCMLQLDRWIDRRGRPPLNVMVSFPTGVVFWKSHCMSGKDKGAEAYFNIPSEAIKEVGEKVVVGVIMDNATVCARAGRLVEDTFPTIFHVPCAAHCLDLMLHDIGRTDWVKEVVGKGNDLVKFFMNHQRVCDIFYVHSGGRQLLRPAATRFATNFHMLDRLKKQRNALVATVSHDARRKPTVVPHAQRDTFYEMEEIILDGAGSWEGVNKVIAAVYDIVLLLKVVDGTGPTVSKVYAKMDKAVERLRANSKLKKDEREDIEEMVMRRWNAMTTPLHCAALFLDPEYRSYEPQNDPQIQDGLTWLYTWLRGRSQEVIDQVEYEVDCWVQNIGKFSTEKAMEAARKQNPATWWLRWCIELRYLQPHAIRLLGQGSSASGCERNWSLVEAIHTRPRNGLAPETMQKLVYCRWNMRNIELQGGLLTLPRLLRSSTRGGGLLPPLFGRTNVSRWENELCHGSRKLVQHDRRIIQDALRGPGGIYRNAMGHLDHYLPHVEEYHRGEDRHERALLTTEPPETDNAGQREGTTGPQHMVKPCDVLTAIPLAPLNAAAFEIRSTDVPDAFQFCCRRLNPGAHKTPDGEWSAGYSAFSAVKIAYHWEIHVLGGERIITSTNLCVLHQCLLVAFQ